MYSGRFDPSENESGICFSVLGPTYLISANYELPVFSRNLNLTNISTVKNFSDSAINSDDQSE